MRYNGKIFRQIWKKYSETIFLIDSCLRIFRTTRLKRQHDHFNDISHAFRTESNTILIKH